MARRTRRWVPLVLVIAFVVMPIAEIYVLIQVGQVIGVWWTILLLVADSIFGTWLIRREGRKAWQALSERITTGRMPHRELADGALIVLGGALMLSPGFVTDLFGVFLILPFTRPLFRRLVLSYAARRATGAVSSPLTQPGNHTRPGPDVVQGEVIDPE